MACIKHILTDFICGPPPTVNSAYHYSHSHNHDILMGPQAPEKRMGHTHLEFCIMYNKLVRDVV